MKLYVFTYNESDLRNWQEKPLTVAIVAGDSQAAKNQLQGMGGLNLQDYEIQTLNLNKGAYVATYAFEPFVETNEG